MNLAIKLALWKELMVLDVTISLVNVFVRTTFMVAHVILLEVSCILIIKCNSSSDLIFYTTVHLKNCFSVRATCDDTSMIIEVTPFDYSDGSPFSGTIFGSPTDSFSALPVPCTFTGDNGRYGITLDYSSVNGDCGKPIVSRHH